MRSWGGTMILLGIGSFILPMFGRQFILLSFFGSATPVIAVVLILAGGALIYFDREE